MKKKSSAFRLIKSMNTSEKRYFQVYSQKHIIGSENKYISLFSLLNEMNEEDDESIKKSFEKDNRSAQYLEADKNYLYRLLLRSFLSFYHNKTTTIYQIEQLFTVEILYEKGLYDLCQKEIDKTAKVAEKVENYSLMIELLSWERKVKGYTKGFQAAYQTNQRIKHYMKLQMNQIELTDLYYESLNLRYAGFQARDSQQIQKFEELLANPLLTSEDSALSLVGKIRYHLVHSNYYYVKNDVQNESKHLAKIIILMNTSEYYAIENPFDYVYVYYYWLDSLRKEQPEIFHRHLSDFRKFTDRVEISKEKVKLLIFVFSNLAEVDMLITQRKYQQALDIIPNIEAGWNERKENIEPAWHIKFYYQVAYIHLALGNHKKALHYLNIILNNYEEEQRADYFNYAKILNIITHFHLQNFELIPYLHTTTISYYKKRNKLHPTENIILKLFKNTSNYTDKRSISVSFHKLLENLHELDDLNYEKPAFDLFDLELWVQAVLENQNMYAFSLKEKNG